MNIKKIIATPKPAAYLLVLALLLSVFSATASAYYTEDNPSCVNLVMGRAEQVVGDVCVWNDSTNLYVTLTADSDSPYALDDAHVCVASSDLGWTPPGQCDCGEVFVPPITSHTCTIPLLSVSGSIWIQAQATINDTSISQKVGSAYGETFKSYFQYSPVRKYASKEYVKRGEVVLYTVVVGNPYHDSPLKMMEVKETMQTGMKYDEKSCSLLGITAVEVKETVMKSEGMTSWKVEDGSRILEIAPGASTEFTLTATIDQDAVKGQILGNVIEVIVQRAGGVGFTTYTAETVVTVR